MSARALLALLAALSAHAARVVRTPRPTVVDPSLRNYGNVPVWPLPASATDSGVTTTLDPAHPFNLTYAADDFLDTITARFLPLIYYHPAGAPQPGRPVLATVSISVNDSSVRQIQQDTDESYSLSFAPGGQAAAISAQTIFGARHALETLSQLVDADRLTGAYSVQTLNVTEAPRFPYRGLLVDSARQEVAP